MGSRYMRYQNVIGRYQSIMEREKKDLGQCPNDKPHRGVEEQRVLRTTDKGGTCLIPILATIKTSYTIV